MEIYNYLSVKQNIGTVSSAQQKSDSNIFCQSSLEQNSETETTCCEQLYQIIVSCFTSIIDWMKSFFSSSTHETPLLTQGIRPLGIRKKERGKKGNRWEFISISKKTKNKTNIRRKYNGSICPGGDLIKQINNNSDNRQSMLPDGSAGPPLFSLPCAQTSAPRIKMEKIIRIHALNSESELILVCFRPGNSFFLDEEDADVRVIKGDAAWDTVQFNDGYDEDLQKKFIAKVIREIQKTTIRVLHLPTFCQNLVPPYEGLDIRFSEMDSFKKFQFIIS